MKRAKREAEIAMKNGNHNLFGERSYQGEIQLAMQTILEKKFCSKQRVETLIKLRAPSKTLMKHV
jgi:hypothetical protein